MNPYEEQLEQVQDKSSFRGQDQIYKILHSAALELINQTISQSELESMLTTDKDMASDVVSQFWIRYRGLKEVSRVIARLQDTIKRWRVNKTTLRVSQPVEITDPTTLHKFKELNYFRELYSLDRVNAIKKLSNLKKVIDEIYKDYTIYEEGTLEYEDSLLSVYWSLIHEDVTLIGYTDEVHIRYVIKSVDAALKSYIRDIIYAKEFTSYEYESPELTKSDRKDWCNCQLINHQNVEVH